jgi:hypothetical protein
MFPQTAMPRCGGAQVVYSRCMGGDSLVTPRVDDGTYQQTDQCCGCMMGEI